MDYKALEIKRIVSFDGSLISTLFSKLDVPQMALPNNKFFESNINILLVGFVNSKPVGFLYAYLLEDLKSSQPSIILYSIDVFKNYRRKGIATQLIDKLKSISLSHNCRKIFVVTEAQNSPAINLYRKTGSEEIEDDVVLVFN
jgi:aminoglycoside 3-N-acetyltransferase I